MATRKGTSPGSPIPLERITQSILLIRGHKVMLDADLAALYEVETRVLIQAVKRNLDRFPEDFMFQLTKQEFDDLRSHFVTSSWSGRRHPRAYDPTGTEEETPDRLCAVGGSVKMRRIGKRLHEQQAEAVKLDNAIVANLMGLGYGG